MSLREGRPPRKQLSATEVAALQGMFIAAICLVTHWRESFYMWLYGSYGLLMVALFGWGFILRRRKEQRFDPVLRRETLRRYTEKQ